MSQRTVSRRAQFVKPGATLVLGLLVGTAHARATAPPGDPRLPEAKGQTGREPENVQTATRALGTDPSGAGNPSDPNTPSSSSSSSSSSPASIPSIGSASPEWIQLRGQATFILQMLPSFPEDYPGRLPARSQAELSHSYTLFLGLRPLEWFEAFVDPEMVRGDGLNHGSGLAGFTNGDVIRNPSVGKDPYAARYFGRFTIPLGTATTHTEVDDHIFAADRPSERLVITFGRLGSNDTFDASGYANSTRTQFMNWSFINNTAWDYAADTRGYTQGLSVEWVNPEWTLRLGSYQMPTTANGLDLDGHLFDARGDNLEFEFRAGVLRSLLGDNDLGPMTIRLLAFRNMSRAGRYADAIALGRATATAPDITAVRQTRTAKYGFGINAEQPLADEGATGLFARAGWNNGVTETFAFTESDLAFSLGAQLSGNKWGRKDDKIGIAYAQNFLSSAHKDYLEAGGVGFQVGDGRVTYAPERIFETYYSLRLTDFADLSAGYQLIANPGYNRDRGPANVFSIRLHLFF